MILILRKNLLVIHAIELDGKDLLIGRSKEADLVLDDSEVSKKHARLYSEEGKYFVEDLGSSNGLYLGKSKVLRAEITSDTPIQIGPFQLLLSSDEDTLMSFSENAPPMDEETKSNEGLDASTHEETLPHGGVEEKPMAPAKKTRAQLVQMDGSEKGRKIDLNEDEITLGIEDTADIAVDSEEDSFEMAKILRREGKFFFEDAKTLVNPEMQSPLKNDQELQIGDHKYRFEQSLATPSREFSKVLERPRSKPGRFSKFNWKDWRVLLAASLLFSFLTVALLQSRSSQPGKTTPNTDVLDSEGKKLELYHLNLARRDLDQKKYKMALDSVDRILEKIAPLSPEAKTLREEILLKQAQETALVEERKRRLAESQDKIRAMLSAGEAALKKKNIGAAREAFEQVLFLDPDHSEAGKGMERASQEEAEAKKKESEAKAYDLKLNGDYEMGVSSFEEGNYREASELLRPIAKRSGHPYQNSSKKLLSTIRKRSRAQTKEKVTKAQVLADAGEIRSAYDELKKLQRKYPKNKDVDEAMQKVRTQMYMKAKELYTKGIASEELLEDISGALDYYKEVLKYAPEADDEYHLKANKKIRKFELTP